MTNDIDHIEVNYICRSCGYSISHSNIIRKKTLQKALDTEVIHGKECYVCGKISSTPMSVSSVKMHIQKEKEWYRLRTQWFCNKCSTTWISTETIPRDRLLMGHARALKENTSCPNELCSETEDIRVIKVKCVSNNST